MCKLINWYLSPVTNITCISEFFSDMIINLALYSTDTLAGLKLRILKCSSCQRDMSSHQDT